jgi:hypothetical protein
MKGVALTEGKLDEAITVFRAILADFPELPEPRNNLRSFAQKGSTRRRAGSSARSRRRPITRSHTRTSVISSQLATVECEGDDARQSATAPQAPS